MFTHLVIQLFSSKLFCIDCITVLHCFDIQIRRIVCNIICHFLLLNIKSFLQISDSIRFFVDIPVIIFFISLWSTYQLVNFFILFPDIGAQAVNFILKLVNFVFMSFFKWSCSFFMLVLGSEYSITFLQCLNKDICKGYSQIFFKIIPDVFLGNNMWKGIILISQLSWEPNLAIFVKKIAHNKFQYKCEMSLW